MSKLMTGMINYDELMKGIKSGQVSTYKTEAGKRFFWINVWVNDEPDKYDNDAGIQLQQKKEFKDEKNIYIGNLKYKELGGSGTEPKKEEFEEEEDDLAF